MILDACGGRGYGEKDTEGLARDKSGEGSGKREVDRKDRVGRGRWQQGGGDGEGSSREGSNRDGKRVAMRRGTTWRGR